MELRKNNLPFCAEQIFRHKAKEWGVPGYVDWRQRSVWRFGQAKWYDYFCTVPILRSSHIIYNITFFSVREVWIWI